MDKRKYRVHTSRPKLGNAVYTPKLKDIKADLTARRSPLSGSLLAGNLDTPRLRDFIVFYFNGADPQSLLILAGDLLDVYINVETASDAEMRQLEEAAEELRQSLPKFKAAVRWLCSPKTDKDNEAQLSYFTEHGLKHFKLLPTLQDNRLILRPKYLHCVDALCAYLLNECNERLPEEMPLKVCHCGRLFASDLVSAKFCSAQCREKGCRSPERKRDYYKICRWEDRARNALQGKAGFTLKDIKQLGKITSRKNELNNIAERWKDWELISDKVEYIRDAISQLHT